MREATLIEAQEFTQFLGAVVIAVTMAWMSDSQAAGSMARWALQAGAFSCAAGAATCFAFFVSRKVRG